jgi:hypothetical protein
MYVYMNKNDKTHGTSFLWENEHAFFFIVLSNKKQIERRIKNEKGKVCTFTLTTDCR